MEEPGGLQFIGSQRVRHDRASNPNAGDIRDMGSIPVWGRSPGVGMATHSSILAWRIPVDIGAWWVTVHGVAKSQT